MNLQNSLDLLANIFVKIDSKKQMKLVIEDLLTPQEIIDLSDRILLLKQLKPGKKQRDIS